ncbi:hypothetical protein PV327_001785 [Microctonus hyperodae]|uniref:Aminopeptidase n=1 Tax=Microctonus hyperodae TaxID=165561 RepID=A0AA39KNH3_MICHY|nr:hypothetical protein PV327_001785 [Microctonus hyperodae]
MKEKKKYDHAASANMSQFSSNRQEFTTSEPGMDGIEYQREGGYFLTHRRIAIVITASFLLLVAAGFIGAYVGALPRKKIFDTTALIAEDAGSEPADAAKYSLPTSIFPLRYSIELTPIVEDNVVSRVRGRVVIQFSYNATTTLRQIVLNAKSMNITKMKLLYKNENGEFQTRKRRSPQENDVTKYTTIIPISDSTQHAMTTIANQENQQQNVSSTTMKPLNFTTNSSHNVLLAHSTFNNATKSQQIKQINVTYSDIDEQHGILTITPASTIKSGFYSLEIDYEARGNNMTLIVANYSDENTNRWLMITRLKPINARALFPAFDDVRLKARFTLTVNHSKEMTVLTNTPLKSSNTFDNWTIDTFHETPLLSPHSLALIEGNLISVGKVIANETAEIPINFWSEQGQDFNPIYLKNTIVTVIKHFEDLFSVNYPMKKLDIVSVPFAENSGNAGLISIKQNLFNVTDTSPGITRYNALRTLIRLIGRQWLGGLINSQNWTDVWILESSLIDLQHTIIQKIDPTFNHSTFLLDVQLEAFEADGYSVSQSLSSKVNPAYLEAFHPDELYDRGACILRMLHGILRSNDSRIGYKTFVSRWANGNADVNSFIQVMTNGSSDYLSHEVNIVMAIVSWINGHGYPVVEIKRDYKTGSVKISQHRFRFDNRSRGDEGGPWYIPLTWVSEGNNWSLPSFAWINPKEKEVTLDNVGHHGNKSWVVFNVNSTGYFRVNYDENNWELIANALIENPTTFPSSVKASLVDDVLSLAFVGSTTYATAFNVINYLKNESQPEPWTALMRHAIKLNLVLYDTPVYPSYQEFMRKLTTSLFSKVGIEVEIGKRITLIAHQLGATFEDVDYVNWAKSNYDDLKTSYAWDKRYAVPSYLRETLLCTFAKLEDQVGWQWWQEKLENITRRDADRNSFLSSLACFQVPWILQAVLNEIVRGDFFSESDALVILKAFDKHPVSAEVAFKFVQRNWPDILQRFAKSYPILRAFVGSVSSGFTSDRDLIDFQSFRDTNYESLKPVGYITAFVEAKGTSWVSFLNHSLVDFEKTLIDFKKHEKSNVKLRMVKSSLNSTI